MARSRWLVLGALVLLAGCGSETTDDAKASSPQEKAGATTTSSGAPPTTLASRTDTSVTAAPPGGIPVRMENYEFSPSNLTVKAGNVTIFLANTDDGVVAVDGRAEQEIHDLSIIGNVGLPIAKSARLDPGQTAAFTIEGMKPGSYLFICSLHAAAQMRGTIEVTA